KMTSEDRIKLFVRYYGVNALAKNNSFENSFTNKTALEGHIIDSATHWIKTQNIKVNMEEAIQNIKDNLSALKTDRILSTDLKPILQNTVGKLVGVNITPDELNKINDFQKDLTENLSKFDKATEQWTDKEAKTKFGLSFYTLDNYIASLSQPANIRDAWNSFLTQVISTKEQVGTSEAILKALGISLKDFSDLSISIVANLDNSVIGLQLSFLMGAHPIAWAKIAGHTFQDAFKNPQQVMTAVLSKFYSDPNFIMGRMNNLLPKVYEELPSFDIFVLAEQNKFLKVPARAFNISQTIFRTGYIRALQFYNDYILQCKKLAGIDINDPTLIKNVQDYTRTFLLQAPIGRSRLLNASRVVLWATGLMKGSWMTSVAYPLGFAPPGLKGIGAKESWKAILGQVLLTFLVATLLHKKVNTDPRASTFMAINLTETRDVTIRIGPGFIYDVLIARLALHFWNMLMPSMAIPNYKSAITGKVSDTAHPQALDPDMWNILIDFTQNKTKPMVGLFIDMLQNEAFGGRQLTWKEMVKSIGAPISVQNAVETASEVEHWRQPASIMADILDFIGLRSNTYIRSIKMDEVLTKEIYRLSDAGYEELQTGYHLGFLADKKLLTSAENKYIDEDLTLLINQHGLEFINSPTYKTMSDKDRAKRLANGLDSDRDDAYYQFLEHQISITPPNKMVDMFLRYDKAGVLNVDRWNGLLGKNAIPKEVVDEFRKKINSK
ncbi:MAG: hypothetical protein NT145_05565, partial [Elusimicrobia bacterium]|nr:hypothetical protein [Elusimicrobiota bacterium]